MNKKLLTTLLVGALATTSASAQNNNTGEIVIQGVMPGTWELTVYDINSGYDFDLTCLDAICGDGTNGAVSARVGTIHVQTNANTASSVNGLVFVESVNAGRMINSSSLPGIADSHLEYEVTLSLNPLGNITGIATAVPLAATQANEITLDTAFDLLTPKILPMDGATLGDSTYDVIVTLPAFEEANSAGTWPDAAGVYTDTLVFTIVDDL